MTVQAIHPTGIRVHELLAQLLDMPPAALVVVVVPDESAFYTINGVTEHGFRKWEDGTPRGWPTASGKNAVYLWTATR